VKTHMTGIGTWLTETHREVGRRRIAAGEARTALIRRRYDAPIEDVWQACTDPDRLSRWFIRPTGNLRAGGTFKLEGNASGEILRCEPPRRLTVTWSYPGRPVDELELRLSPGEDGDTVLELEHASVAEVFIANDPETGMWGIGAGWEVSLDYLGKYLRGELLDATAAEWWKPTQEDVELGNLSLGTGAVTPGRPSSRLRSPQDTRQVRAGDLPPWTRFQRHG
jgi:uncharacterized protein YndB with AHSA1/START domain